MSDKLEKSTETKQEEQTEDVLTKIFSIVTPEGRINATTKDVDELLGNSELEDIIRDKSISEEERQQKIIDKLQEYIIKRYGLKEQDGKNMNLLPLDPNEPMENILNPYSTIKVFGNEIEVRLSDKDMITRAKISLIISFIFIIAVSIGFRGALAYIIGTAIEIMALVDAIKITIRVCMNNKIW